MWKWGFEVQVTTVTVSSVTYAIKVKKILNGMKINARIVKVGSSKPNGGCEYGVEFQNVYFYDVIAKLKELGLEYSIYKQEKV